MKKSTKTLLLLLIIGLIGMAATTGFAIGSGMLRSYEASKDSIISEPFDAIRQNTSAASVTIVPAETARVHVFAKAWLAEPIDPDELVDIRVRGNVLEITETPLPPEFFGLFPQPYELIVTLFVPEDIYETITGGTQ